MPELQLTDFNDAILEENTIVAPDEPHMACVLLLDTAGSMIGDPIESLDKAINSFKTTIKL